MKNILLVIVLLFNAFLSEAQDIYFRNYQVNDGISSNTVTCILQDQKGFIWFGTRNGLNRFDGTHFKIFKNDILDSLTIGSNSILSLFEDEAQRLWVGTYKGVYLYDAVHETFTLFNKVSQNEIRQIKGDKEGNVWMIANNVLSQYNPKNNTVKTYNAPNTLSLALSIADNGTVWSATNSGFLRKYNAIQDTFTDYDIAPLYNGESPVFIQTIYPVSDTSLLVSTFKQTYLFNTTTRQLSNVFAKNAWGNNIQVHEIIQQSANEYWLGTENGLCILNLTSGASRLVQKQYANPYSISDNVIDAFCKDKEGSIWIGTFFGGINYYSRQLNQFQKYFPVAGTNSLSGNLVHEITNDKYNSLWVGTEDGGLNKINAATGFIEHFKPGNKRSISYQNVHGLLADENELWIGTYEHGLDVMDLRTEKVIRHYEKSSKANSLNSNFIVTIYKTKKGNVLIGTWGGLFQYNRKKNNFQLLPYFERQAQAVHEDETGTMWVCSYGNGVYYANDSTGIRGSFQYDANNANSLPSNYVNNLFEDSKKNIWFCTEAGLCKYDFRSKKIIPYTHFEHLQDNQMFRVLEDAAGILWISTSKGLVQLNPATNTTTVFNTQNGLLSDQFNYNSAFKNSRGTMYFGTVKGMVSFNPKLFSKPTYVPPVYITDIQINNKPVNIHDGASPLQQAVIYTKKITLPYDSSTISLDVAALSYIAPGLNEYAYKMDGLDKDWLHINSNRPIYYTKLPPGNYTFRVKAISNHTSRIIMKLLSISLYCHRCGQPGGLMPYTL